MVNKEDLNKRPKKVEADFDNSKVEQVNKRDWKQSHNANGSHKRIPNFWWVCQGKSYTADVGRLFLWAPHKGRNGRKQVFWSAVKEVVRGDIIFNYANRALRGVSIAKKNGYPFKNEDPTWEAEGTRVDIDHHEFSNELPIAQIQKHFDTLKLVLKDVKNRPFDRNGDVRQGFLFGFNLEAAKVIRSVYGKPFPKSIEESIKTDFENIKGTEPLIENPLIELIIKKKQVILYGPPGTGKTYKTKHLSIQLIESEV